MKKQNLSESIRLHDPAFSDGIPVKKLNQALDRIRMYKQLATLAVLANTILILMGIVYL